MGCDIHIYIEVKSHALREFLVSKGCDPMSLMVQEEYSSVSGEDFLLSRNYILFAYLAGVRNYYKVTPFETARGFPMNSSMDVKHDMHQWFFDAHHAGWFTFSQLKEKINALGDKVPVTMYVSEESEKLYKEKGIEPRGFSLREEYGTVPHICYVDKEVVFGELLKAMDFFKKATSPKINKDIDPNTYDDIFRIVFWFDN